MAMNNRWRRWAALQLASSLPDNPKDADAILQMAREIYYQSHVVQRDLERPKRSGKPRKAKR
jgi:hypothetical protein